MPVSTPEDPKRRRSGYDASTPQPPKRRTGAAEAAGGAAADHSSDSDDRAPSDHDDRDDYDDEVHEGSESMDEAAGPGRQRDGVRAPSGAFAHPCCALEVPAPVLIHACGCGRCAFS
jgi:hypothetical protein